jgi:hypothetical protein
MLKEQRRIILPSTAQIPVRLGELFPIRLLSQARIVPVAESRLAPEQNSDIPQPRSTHHARTPLRHLFQRAPDQTLARARQPILVETRLDETPGWRSAVLVNKDAILHRNGRVRIDMATTLRARAGTTFPMADIGGQVGLRLAVLDAVDATPPPVQRDRVDHVVVPPVPAGVREVVRRQPAAENVPVARRRILEEGEQLDPFERPDLARMPESHLDVGRRVPAASPRYLAAHCLRHLVGQVLHLVAPVLERVAFYREEGVLGVSHPEPVHVGPRHEVDVCLGRYVPELISPTAVLLQKRCGFDRKRWNPCETFFDPTEFSNSPLLFSSRGFVLL